MLKKVLEILRESAADDFEVTEYKETGWEFYFIGHKLDQNRAKTISQINVRVLKKSEDGKFLGNAEGVIPVPSTEDEIRRMVNDLIYQAGLVQNPYYDIRSGDGKPVKAEKAVDVKKMAQDFIEALASVKETETEYLNSYEIFTSAKERRIVNSRGVDVSMTYPYSMIEVVTNAKNGDKEIELYRLYNRGTCDKQALVRDVEDTLRFGKDKLIARDTPAVKKAPLLLTSGEAKSVSEYFFDRVYAGAKYMGFSDWEIGTPIVENPKGDKVSLRAVAELENSSQNFPYDSEGAPIREGYLIKDNVPEHLFGIRKFSEYLGLGDNSDVYNYVMDGGTHTEEELRKGPYLEVVDFSAFDVDSIRGDIAGEIRLGYWHDGEKVIPVSGGSVSGNMKELAAEMYMSKELRQYDNGLIPAIIRIENVSVTGIE